MVRALMIALSCLAAPLAVQAGWEDPVAQKAEKAAPVALLPFPQRVEWLGTAKGAKSWKLTGDAVNTLSVQVAWKGLLADKPGVAAEVQLVLSPDTLPEADRAEGYQMEVKGAKVRISAATEVGLFYGLQTLRQLVAEQKELPQCRITDYPAFRLRGFMHDCGRNFQTIAALQQQLDCAARLKLNTFHWHLTDHPAWHVESKAYPILNDPQHRTRDKEDTYSFDDVRELFAYARERHITIIPELDMPGHSSYFKRCFGFDMHSEQGMPILEALLEEFCREVPADICPYVHIGADEVRVPNAKAFVKRMSDKLISMGRKPMQWGGPRDLPVGEDSIAQRWGEGGEMVEKSLKPETIRCHTVDSAIGYTNLFEPALLVRRYFFMKPCGVDRGDEQKMGGIICTWPDARVDDKAKIIRHNGVWPTMCAMADKTWRGGDGDGDAYPCAMPALGTPAGDAFARLEKRMEVLARTVFKGQAFPYWPQSSVTWQVVPPVPTPEADPVREKVLSGQWAELQPITAHGACLYLRTRPSTGYIGLFPKQKPGVTTWAITTLKADKAGDAPFMVGFDAPARSSRRFSGVAPAGCWSNCGTRIWVNGQEVKNPHTFKLAGQNRFNRDTWFHAANENPFDDEEIWWCHKPVTFPLKKGDNTIIVEQPYIGECQSWEVNIIPLKH